VREEIFHLERLAMGLDRDDPVVRWRIAGLCERLDVDPRIHELITYIYALLDNDADGSLDSTRVILQKAMAPENLSARQRGAGSGGNCRTVRLSPKHDT
jgi:hypothetical protein